MFLSTTKKNRSNLNHSISNHFDNFWQAFDDFFDHSLGNLNQYISNTDGSLSFTLDVPGFNNGDLVVETNSKYRTISVRGEVKNDYSHRSVNNTFSVPETHDFENPGVVLSAGVLTLTFKKLENGAEENIKQIPIKIDTTNI